MNLKYLIITIIMALSSFFAQAGTFADKYMDQKGVTVVYISKAMMKMFPAKKVALAGDMNVGSIVSNLESIIVLTTNNSEMRKEMKKDILEIRKDKNYETLMKVRDDDTKVDFYTRMKSPDVIGEILMVVDEPDECVVIQFTGNMTAEDIEALMNSK